MKILEIATLLKHRNMNKMEVTEMKLKSSTGRLLLPPPPPLFVLLEHRASITLVAEVSIEFKFFIETGLLAL
jgi:hypothetical protein